MWAFPPSLPDKIKPGFLSRLVDPAEIFVGKNFKISMPKSFFGKLPAGILGVWEVLGEGILMDRNFLGRRFVPPGIFYCSKISIAPRGAGRGEILGG